MNAEQPTVLRSGLLLALIAAGGVALLSGIHLATEDRIAAQERRVMEQQLARVLPAGRYDNDPLEDVLVIEDAPSLDAGGPVLVHRARLGGKPSAAVLRVTAPDGYNGDIVLLVGILADGTVSGVRVLRHRETPGLGDPIEARRSDWIERFRGRSLGDPAPAAWAVRKDGGDFDQFTGATITPRAVVGAVKRALQYFEDHREALFRGRQREEKGARA